MGKGTYHFERFYQAQSIRPIKHKLLVSFTNLSVDGGLPSADASPYPLFVSLYQRLHELAYIVQELIWGIYHQLDPSTEWGLTSFAISLISLLQLGELPFPSLLLLLLISPVLSP